MNIQTYAYLAVEGCWTDAFAQAVQELHAGGGRLFVPAGTYVTGPIELKSNITLELEAGAVIRFLDDPNAFPLVDTEFEGLPVKAYMPCVYARDAVHVRITGDGTLDGSGRRWWKAKRENSLAHPRPYLVCFQNCQDVSIDHVTLVNSPCWTVHPLYCDHVVISHVTIRNPADSPNTDGINPDSSRNVRIADCLIDVGDDCIAIKAGTEHTPTKKPCENIIISGCHMLNGHGGVVIGSEMSGGVKNVQVVNCIFQGTDRGIRLKTRRGRGGFTENLCFSHILMKDVMCPFVFNMYYFCGKGGREDRVRDKSPHSVDVTTPAIQDVSISDVTVRGATACAGFLYGLPERPVERVSISGCTVVMHLGKSDIPAMMEGIEPMEAAGFFLRNVRDFRFENMRVINALGDEIDSNTSVHWEESERDEENNISGV